MSLRRSVSVSFLDNPPVNTKQFQVAELTIGEKTLEIYPDEVYTVGRASNVSLKIDNNVSS